MEHGIPGYASCRLPKCQPSYYISPLSPLCLYLSVDTCAYTYMHSCAHMDTGIHGHTCAHTYTHTCPHTSTHVHKHPCLRSHVHTHPREDMLTRSPAFMCKCAVTYICTHVYICANMYTRKHVQVCCHVHMHTCASVLSHTYAPMCTHALTRTHAHMCKRAVTYTHTHAHTSLGSYPPPKAFWLLLLLVTFTSGLGLSRQGCTSHGLSISPRPLDDDPLFLLSVPPGRP